MAASVPMRQIVSGTSPRFFQFETCTYDLNSVRSRFNESNNSCQRRKKISVYVRGKSRSRICLTSKKTSTLQVIDGEFHRMTDGGRLESVVCSCQRIDSFSSSATDDQDYARSWGTEKRSPGSLSGNFAGDGKSHGEALQIDEPVERTNGSLMANGNSTMNSIEDEAWNLLRDSIVYYCNNPIGTIAANDPSCSSILNYDQVFIRDFIPSGIAFLLKGEYDIVRNFILYTLQLQSWEKTMDCHSPGQGLMPASFKVRTIPLDGDDSATEDVLDPDFGEAAIGRVAPVDSGLWWIILLRAYGKCSGDLSVQERVDVQTGIKMILKLCLADGFDMFPTLLVTDGSCMIDRRMGIHGHPLEIQALFYSALLCAREMLAPEDGSADLIRALNNRLVSLSFHIREYYWVDMKKLNEIYRYNTEEYSYDAVNKFNIYPDQIPSWLVEFMPAKGGYLIGNLQPAHMDFRFFSLGNLWSIVCSLATADQSHAILDLIEEKWSELVAGMPFKICYPALEDQEWRIITGSDPKNTSWSYHNAGSWPTLLWQVDIETIQSKLKFMSDASEFQRLRLGQLTVACIKMNRPEIALKAVQVAESRLSKDKWPEYYDTKQARLIGKQARLFQTWSIAGYLAAKLFLANPNAAKIVMNEEDSELINAMLSANPRKRGRGRKKQSFIV